MEITKTLLINAACLLIPPVVVVLLLRHFFPRKIRWSAGVVALVDLVIFWTDISYYESVWLTLFFVVIQLGVLLLSISCGTLIGYLLCTVFSAMSIFGKVSYHFPTVEMFSYFILMLAVQMLFSCFAIRQIKKQSLVDQMRELS